MAEATLPYFTEFTGQILIAIVTMSWGVLVETWYVGRWTIFFNILPLIVMLMTTDLDSMFWWVVLYTFFGIILVGISGYSGPKHLFGAKTYGLLTLGITLHYLGGWHWRDAILVCLAVGGLVLLLWRLVAVAKMDSQARQRRRQEFYYYHGYWPSW